MIAEIVVDVANNQVNRVFDYKIPESYENIVDCGYRVKVPFGRRKLLGFVVGIKENSDYDTSRLKEIDEVLDLKPIITKEFIDLAKYMVESYYTFYITALKTMIPSALRVKYLKKLHLIDKTGLTDEQIKLFKNDYYIVKKNDNIIKDLSRLIADNKIEVIDDFVDNLGAKKIKMVSLVNDELDYKSSKAQMVVSYLSEIGEDISKSSLIEDLNITPSVLDTLVSHGNIEIYDYEVYRSPEIGTINDNRVVLNEEQEKAYDAIKSSLSKNDVFLLHGVCGSGKTEIYLNLIEDVIKSGKEAIMLVPEISLTPQVTQRFKARFKDVVAVLHSRLSQGEKYDEWRRIINGHAKIVVGARSALFAPFKNLGLIVIDEEHEKSYIQDTNPKYDAISVATFRAKYNNCPLVLGSATPRISSYKNAQMGEYKLLSLPSRANGKPQRTSTIVDMRQELKEGNKKVFSRILLDSIKETYKKGEQSILFLNKRGFSTFVMCRSCGEVIKCPNCDVSLTYHKTDNSLMCHYCGHKEPSPTKCPKCGSGYIRYVGNGTEKIVDALKLEIPGIRVLRVDYDTTKAKNSYDIMFDSFRNGEADVMVGTQIIAKGLDFPKVSLVGVINADIGLKMPMYDSAEITYDLLEQVSGRAGRAETDGNVIIQTYNPEHYSIKYAANHDYKGFYLEEIRVRRMSYNPPFSERVEIIVSSNTSQAAHVEAVKIVNTLKTKANDSIILGPIPDFRSKINGMYYL